MNKKIKWGIIIIIALGFTGLGIYRFTPKKNGDLKEAYNLDAKKKNKVLNVTAEVIKERSLTDGISITGLTLPDEEVNLSFEVSGKIMQINFDEGTRVRKGQILAKVNDAPLKAQLHRLNVQLQLAQDRVYRQDALLKKEAVSKEAYEQAQTDFATLKAEIDIVKSNIAQTELKAPFDGIIGLRQVSEGAYASLSTIVATLTKITPLKIEFSVPERYAGIIKNGTNLEFSLEGKLTAMKAKVYASESKVDPETHTFSMRAYYSNANEEILPGRFVNVYLKTQEIDTAIAIPAEAIVPEMGVDKVFLYKSGKAQPVEVKKGIRNEERVQILKGLVVGDTILTSGTLQLRTGLSVKLDEIE